MYEHKQSTEYEIMRLIPEDLSLPAQASSPRFLWIEGTSQRLPSQAHFQATHPTCDDRVSKSSFKLDARSHSSASVLQSITCYLIPINRTSRPFSRLITWETCKLESLETNLLI
jgi:hypothetical protein